MVNVSVARRYARALLEACAEGESDVVLQQLETVVAFLAANEAIAGALENPAVPKSQRMAVTEALIGAAGGLKPVLANLLKLLTDRNRFAALPGLARLFREAVDAKLGRVRGQLTTAKALAPAQLEAIRTQLEAMTQKKVMLEAGVDASLLGGVVAQVGSRRYDGSLKSQLVDLGRKLSAPAR
jgi:F-type H+-transporting ATPase subunit delta